MSKALKNAIERLEFLADGSGQTWATFVLEDAGDSFEKQEARYREANPYLPWPPAYLFRIDLRWPPVNAVVEQTPIESADAVAQALQVQEKPPG